MKATVVLPSLGRRLSTHRAIHSVLDQTETDWELLIYGDNCPVIGEIIQQRIYQDHRIKIDNSPTRHGTPAQLLDEMIAVANGEYLFFLGNDDFFLPNHIEAKTTEIQRLGCDLLITPSLVWIDQYKQIRLPELEFSKVGHSEITVKTEVMRRFKHDKDYGHDWKLIKDIIDAGASYTISYIEPTLVVCHISPKSSVHDYLFR